MTINLNRVLNLFSLAVVFGVSAAYGAPAGSRGPAETGKALCPDCNVVVVSLDALQAAHVHALGYGRDVTPGLDRLAAKGVLFKQAISPAPWTVPATMSLFTGTYPSVHRVVNKFTVFNSTDKVVSNLQKLSPGIKTLAEILKERGYAAGGFTGDAGVNGVFGFKAGFDVYSDSVPAFSGFDQSVPKALAWLETVKDRKFFLFLHGYDFHGQYLPGGGFDRRYVAAGYKGPYDGSPAQQGRLREEGLLSGRLDLSAEDVAFWRAIYDEKITRADALLSGFMTSFDALGLSKKTVLVLLADHGTEFFEHGRIDHGATLYDELVHVPLIVIVPGVKPGVVEPQVSTLALMPTVLELVGAVPDQALKLQMKAESLAPLLSRKRGKGRDAFMETDYRLYTHKRAVRASDGWKLILTLETGVKELYDLNSDPAEKLNLAAEKPELAASLLNKLRSVYIDLGAGTEQWGGGCSPVYADQCLQ